MPFENQIFWKCLILCFHFCRHSKSNNWENGICLEKVFNAVTWRIGNCQVHIYCTEIYEMMKSSTAKCCSRLITLSLNIFCRLNVSSSAPNFANFHRRGRKLQRVHEVECWFYLLRLNLRKLVKISNKSIMTLKKATNHSEVLWKTAAQKIFSGPTNLQEKYSSTGVFLAIQGDSSKSSHPIEHLLMSASALETEIF